MENEIRNKLCEEIRNCLDDLTNLNLGSEEYAAAVKNLEVLYKLKIEDERADEDYTIRQCDVVNKKLENQDRRWNQYLGLGVNVLGGFAQMVFLNSWTKKGFEFEKTGGYASKTFQIFHPKYKPFWK